MTPRGAALVALLAVLAYALALSVSWTIVLAAVLILAALALGADALALARGGVSIEREPPPRLALARRAHFGYDVVNRAGSARVVSLVEAPVPRLALGVAERRTLLPAFSRTRLTIDVLPRERGRTALRSFHARVTTGAGLVERRCRWDAPAHLRVSPDLSALDRGDLAARTKLLDAGLRRLRRRGLGGEFESLREYGPDDAFRAIDWKATARRGRTMVAQYEVERSQQIVVAIDAGRLMTPRLGDRRKLDYAVSAALAITAAARLAADRVGLYAFGASALARVAPGTGAVHAARLTDALADLEGRFEEADYERAVLDLDRMLARRSLVVLFTDLFDPAASSAVLAATRLLTRRHLVLLVLMNDAAIEDALARDPADAEDAYRAAVAVTLAAERATAIGVLRQRGVLVVDVPAAELSLALLDAYVEIKTRGRL